MAKLADTTARLAADTLDRFAVALMNQASLLANQHDPWGASIAKRAARNVRELAQQVRNEIAAQKVTG